MINCNQSKNAFCRKVKPPTIRRTDSERASRIWVLREKIKDQRYLETALKKLASDLAREFY